jgi:hypothetical protein
MRTSTKLLDPERIVTVKQNIMGRLMDVQMTAVDAATLARYRRQGEVERQRRADKARAAMLRYTSTSSERHRKKALRTIERCSLYTGSENRLSSVLSLIEFARPEIFWPALMETWPGCDATWDARTRLLQALHAMEPALPFFSQAQREFFDALPAHVQVFRGCSRLRDRGVAWTTDRTVAEGFAKGHRILRVSEPVVASAIIPKENIFFVTNDRNEKEVVLNPRRLRHLMIEPYTATVCHTA